MRIGLTNDVVNNTFDRLGGIDENAFRRLLPGLMQTNDESAFSGSRAPLIIRSLVQPLDQCVYVDVKDEHTVEQVNERRKVPRTPAEEGHRFVAVSDQGLDRLYAPNMVFVRMAVRRCAGLWVALVRKFRITVDGVVAASLQLLAHGCLAGARNAFDEEVGSAHWSTVAPDHVRWNGTYPGCLQPGR
jgi:hypothetical protein